MNELWDPVVQRRGFDQIQQGCAVLVALRTHWPIVLQAGLQDGG
jgi:hypothetical protein